MTPVGRRVLLTGAVSAIASTRVDRALADALAGILGASHAVGTDVLWLRRHDGAEISTRYRTPDGYDSHAVLALSWFMRDLADADHAVWMEPRLFDLMAGVQSGLSAARGAPVPLIVTSGYRTIAHNARIETAARNSMHLYGYAADLQAPGFSPRGIALAASFFDRGGIGLYDSFTHLDVWRVRNWTGAPRSGVTPGRRAPAPVGASF